ncbi:MAG: peptidase E [Bacteroidota bacterium]
MNRQIIALGGGGFSMEPENPALDNYILEQAHKPQPKICFIGTASGDSEGYIERFYTHFNNKNCVPSHLSLFKGHTDEIEAFVLQQDIIYVGGGNTRNMLVLWREWGVDKMLKKAYANGTILSGLSAGAICWFEEGLTDSIPNQLNKLDCLGLLKGSNCPHFDGEAERQEAYRNKISNGEMKEGIACDDGVGLHFINERLQAIISSRANGFAYQYTLENNILGEQKMEPIRIL